ncbi:MAG: hypothetical protein WBD86_02415 [Microgenomates group bacterium]
MPDENKPTNLNQPTDQVVTPSTPQDAPDVPTPPSPSTDTPLSPLMDDGSVSPPPPIVEEKKESEQTTAQQQDNGAPADSSVDTDIPPVITTAGAPKRKFGKKTIATILGVLFLVGGIGAGVILVQQQQDIREKAAGGAECAGGVADGKYACSGYSTCVRCDNGRFVSVPNTTSGCPSPCGTAPAACVADGRCRGPNEDCCSGKSYLDTSCIPTDDRCGTKAAPTTPDHPNCNTNKALYSPSDCSGRLVKDHIIREFCNAEGDKYWCKEWQLDWGVPCWCEKPSDYPHVGKDYWLKPAPGETKLECGTSPDPRCTGNGPGITASCLDIKAFDTEWNRITNLSTLKAGDVVRFTVSGSASSGSFDKARFIINSATRPEVTVKRPGTEEFYDEYTIPEDVTSFTINAQVHHSTLGWF